MDGYQTYTADEIGRPLVTSAPDARCERGPRSFLFLQGPISTFFDRLGHALVDRGHRVHRVNFHLGDQLFWHLPATHFRGRFEDWRGVVAELLDRHQVTDLVLHGDRRPYHIIAAEEARARGIAVIATDLGYVRPDWITLEYDGLTTYSRFPRDPAIIRALAAEFPEPEFGPRFNTPFWLIAALDVAYNLGLVLGRPLYRHYRYHSICHPFAEYAGWLRSRPKKLLAARATVAAKRRLQDAPGSYFLVPLQLATDFQIRAHSRYRDVREAVREIISSFAAGTSRRELVFVIHPLDNGLIGWHKLIARLAEEFAVGERVIALHGGTPAELLCNAAGIVTINSTVGVTALYQGLPVKVLGNAVFDIAGLTCQGPLDEFWHNPQPPDPVLLAAFLRALVGTTQIKGGYYERASQDCAIAGFIERFEQRPYQLPPLSAAAFAARPPGVRARSVVVTGVSDAIGMALARGLAGPGVRLCLIGTAAPILAQAEEDCRHRGALVETVCPGEQDADASRAADRIAAFDRRTPVDVLVAHGSADEFGGNRRAGRHAFGAMDAVAAITEPMRRRGSGDIVLVCPSIGRATEDAAAAVRTHGTALGKQLHTTGVRVAVAAPGGIAMRLAARLREPLLVAVGADAVAELVLRGMRRRRGVIAVPGLATLARRVLRLSVTRLGEASRALLPSVDPLPDPREETPLAGESAHGD